MSETRSHRRVPRVPEVFAAGARVGHMAGLISGVGERGERATQKRPRYARLWINGAEVGQPNPRFAHLARSHD